MNYCQAMIRPRQENTTWVYAINMESTLIEMRKKHLASMNYQQKTVMQMDRVN